MSPEDARGSTKGPHTHTHSRTKTDGDRYFTHAYTQTERLHEGMFHSSLRIHRFVVWK